MMIMKLSDRHLVEISYGTPRTSHFLLLASQCILTGNNLAGTPELGIHIRSLIGRMNKPLSSPTGVKVAFGSCLKTDNPNCAQRSFAKAMTFSEGKPISLTFKI